MEERRRRLDPSHRMASTSSIAEEKVRVRLAVSGPNLLVLYHFNVWDFFTTPGQSYFIFEGLKEHLCYET